MVRYGCGGCSNDYETTLTIISRGGEFLVAGFTYEWDTRYSAGTLRHQLSDGKRLHLGRGWHYRTDRQTVHREIHPGEARGLVGR